MVTCDGSFAQARATELLLSAAAVARRANLSKPTILTAFRGEEIGVDSARAIARALRVSLRRLLVDGGGPARSGTETTLPVVGAGARTAERAAMGRDVGPRAMIVVGGSEGR